jgi:hypothetical protein
MFSCVLPSAATAAAEPRRVSETRFSNKVKQQKLEVFIEKRFFFAFSLCVHLPIFLLISKVISIN